MSREHVLLLLVFACESPTARLVALREPPMDDVVEVPDPVLLGTLWSTRPLPGSCATYTSWYSFLQDGSLEFAREAMDAVCGEGGILWESVGTWRSYPETRMVDLAWRDSEWSDFTVRWSYTIASGALRERIHGDDGGGEVWSDAVLASDPDRTTFTGEWQTAWARSSDGRVVSSESRAHAVVIQFEEPPEIGAPCHLAVDIAVALTQDGATREHRERFDWSCTVVADGALARIQIDGFEGDTAAIQGRWIGVLEARGAPSLGGLMRESFLPELYFDPQDSTRIGFFDPGGPLLVRAPDSS